MEVTNLVSFSFYIEKKSDLSIRQIELLSTILSAETEMQNISGRKGGGYCGMMIFINVWSP